MQFLICSHSYPSSLLLIKCVQLIPSFNSFMGSSEGIIFSGSKGFIIRLFLKKISPMSTPVVPLSGSDKGGNNLSTVLCFLWVCSTFLFFNNLVRNWKNILQWLHTADLFPYFFCNSLLILSFHVMKWWVPSTRLCYMSLLCLLKRDFSELPAVKANTLI